jgi:phenylacetate-CoA ligase
MFSPGIGSWIRDHEEVLPRSEIEKLQTERLKAGIERIAAAVPFYRAKLEEAGIQPSSIRSIADLPRLPFTLKSDLRDNYPLGLLAVPGKDVVRIHASSGTTGKPTVVAYTREDLDLWADLMIRCYACAGVGPDDIVHNAFGYGLFTGGLGLHYGAERLGAAVIPVSGGNTRRQLMLIRDLGSTVLCCTPSYALLLAEAAAEEGLDLRASSLRVGIFGAEPWSERMCEEIESRLGVAAFNVYGLSEIIGPGVSVECPFRNGMHVFEDHFFPEVIDPASGQPLPDGDWGELVITCVTKKALPLLRYRTRDRTRLMRDKCQCGRTTVRMDRVVGRTDDMLVVRGVNVFPSQIETVLLQVGDVEPHYQIVVDRNAHHTDELDLLVEARLDVYGDPSQMALLEKRLSYEVQSALGITCNVRLANPGEITRSEGKAQRVVDKRPAIT